MFYCLQVIHGTKRFVTNRVYIFDVLCVGFNLSTDQSHWIRVHLQIRIRLIVSRFSSMITFYKYYKNTIDLHEFQDDIIVIVFFSQRNF